MFAWPLGSAQEAGDGTGVAQASIFCACACAMPKVRKGRGLSAAQRAGLERDYYEDDDEPTRARRVLDGDEEEELEPTLPAGFDDEEISSDDEDIGIVPRRKARDDELDSNSDDEQSIGSSLDGADMADLSTMLDGADDDDDDDAGEDEEGVDADPDEQNARSVSMLAAVGLGGGGERGAKSGRKAGRDRTEGREEGEFATGDGGGASAQLTMDAMLASLGKSEGALLRPSPRSRTTQRPRRLPPGNDNPE